MKEICPVCKTPRNLREQVLDEVLAIVKKEYTPIDEPWDAGFNSAIRLIQERKEQFLK